MILVSVLLAGCVVQDGAVSPDDVEAQVEAAQPWIDSFERWIESGTGSPLASDTRLRALDPGAFDDLDRGRLSIQRRAGVDGVAEGPSAFRAALVWPHVEAEDVRARAKVISVVPVHGESDRGLDVVLRLEILVDDPATTQIVAVVPVELRERDGEELVAVAAEMRTLDRVSTSAPLFVERTAGVFSNAPEAARVLGVGSDRWAQRLDDPALSAWFGHQGLAAGDVTGDGFDDLYVAMPSGLPNMLLVQQPDGTVRDVAAERGVAWLDDTKGVLLVDVTGDGVLDVVSALGHVIVVQSCRDEGPFEIVRWAVAPDEVPFYGIDAGDIDGDGDLDLFGARYVRTQYGNSVPVPFEDARNGPRNCLFLNEDGRFRDASEEVGLDTDGGRFSLQGTFVDHDGDGSLELYVVNDFGRNQLYAWSDGRLEDVAGRIGVEDQGAGMGASWSDYDRDGDLDLYVTNMYSSAGRRVAFQPTFAEGRDEREIEGIRNLSLGNSLLRNDDGRFVQCADDAGVRMGRWAWGSVFVDLDADGWDDLVSPAGFLTGPKPGDL